MSHNIASITQIPGIFAGHYTNYEAATGCTVIICPNGATGGVDVRGGAPATRETDLLHPEQTVDVIHAVVLSGGSAYGLEASCGVARELERAGIGLNVGAGIVPIVSSACVFDLMCGDFTVRPDVLAGIDATRAALANTDGQPLALGNVGAGTGCTTSKLLGMNRAMKGGLGEGLVQSGDLICSAISVVNACGDVVDPHTGRPLTTILPASKHERPLSSEEVLFQMQAKMPLERTNTTVSCVVTNARLTKAQACKVAQMAADGYAHTIRPTHTSNDGDTIFVMATGKIEAPVDVVGVLSAQAVEKAIVSGVIQAQSAYGFTAACDVNFNTDFNTHLADA